MNSGMIQPGIFEDLQKKIDDDTAIKDVCFPIEKTRPMTDGDKQALREFAQALEKTGDTHCSIYSNAYANHHLDRTTQSILSRAHSTTTADRER